MTDTGAEFRRLHRPGHPFVIPNPWDVGTARMFAALGFPALATTSAGLAFSLGLPEGQVSRNAVLDHCRALVDATDLPVSADLEKGFGDSPESAGETIHAIAQTGVAGASLEDHTGNPDDPIYPVALASEKIAAAAEAARRLDHDFVLTARCENYLWGRPDLADTIARLQAYEAAGADVLYAPGLPDLEAIRAVCGSLSGPVNVIMGGPGLGFGVPELADAGVARISVGSAIARLAYGHAITAARAIADTGRFEFGADAMGFAEIEALLRQH